MKWLPFKVHLYLQASCSDWNGKNHHQDVEAKPKNLPKKFATLKSCFSLGNLSLFGTCSRFPKSFFFWFTLIEKLYLADYVRLGGGSGDRKKTFKCLCKVYACVNVRVCVRLCVYLLSASFGSALPWLKQKKNPSLCICGCKYKQAHIHTMLNLACV